MFKSLFVKHFLSKVSRLSLLLLFSWNIGFAQDTAECEKIVEIVIESLDKGNSTPIEQYLSKDFSFAGQQAPMASMVLKQLFTQLGEKVISSEKQSERVTDGGLTFTYNITYEKLGTKEAIFNFNESNQLKEFSLFTMKVKTMDSKTNIERGKEKVIEVPFTMAGKLIAVQVLLNGQKRPFILDTGSPRVILNSKYFSPKDTKSKKIASMNGVGGNISDIDITKIEQLDFHSLQINQQDLLTIDLSHLEEELDTEIYGLIGFELLKDYDVLYDYEGQTISLIQPASYDSYVEENLKGKKSETYPLLMSGHIPIIETQVAGKQVKMGIDSGAETNLLDLTLHSSLLSQIKHHTTDTLSGADKSAKIVLKGKIKKTKVGKQVFKDMETVFSDISHLNLAYKTDMQGIIGYPFLSKQKTLISFKRQEVVFFGK